MGKGHMTLVDVCASSKEAERVLLGSRISQIYSINQNTYLFRFDTASKEQPKVMLLVENGIRMYMTNYPHDKTMQPNGFAMKLRKHLKNLRVMSVALRGFDRCVELKAYSKGNNECFSLIFELFGKGNIYLTSNTFKIMALLRPTVLDDGSKVHVGQQLPVSEQTVFPQDRKIDIGGFDVQDRTIKEVLAASWGVPAIVIQHVGKMHDMDLQSTLASGTSRSAIMDLAAECCSILTSICDTFPLEGYVLKKRTAASIDGKPTYTEFLPYRFEQQIKQELDVESRSSFSEAVDDFFSTHTQVKEDKNAKKKSKKVISKVDRIRQDHESRIDKLKKNKEKRQVQAEAMQHNIELAESAMTLLNAELAKGISWSELQIRLDDLKAATENPIVLCIDSLELSRNEATLQLYHPELDRIALVTVDLGKTAFANISCLYEEHKKNTEKISRTEQATSKALKRAKVKAQAEIAREEKKSSKKMKGGKKSVVRQKLWFEKFYWCVSSEGLLIIAGRDAQQNEKLVRYYLDKNDIYLHAEIHGASSVVIKAPSGSTVIPEQTLIEAGNFCLCRSSAWDSKIVTSAYWVRSNQVSKSAPTGLSLPTGSFMIRGKKNFLPPGSLRMAFGFLFKMKMPVREVVQEEAVEPITYDEAMQNAEESEGSQEASEEEPEEDLMGGESMLEAILELEKEITKVVSNSESKPAPPKLKNKVKAAPRGKRTKLKRMKKKYKDQDEEERIARAQVLGTTALSDQGHALQEQAAQEEKEEEKEEQIDIVVRCFECGKLGHIVRDCPLVAGIDTNEHKAAEETRLTNDILARILPSVDEERQHEIEFAVPVCGPEDALKKLGCRYLAILVPGDGKRGQISNQACRSFYSQTTSTPWETTAMKSVADEDVHQILLSNARLESEQPKAKRGKHPKSKKRSKK